LVNLSHALNYAAGDLDPWGYRAVNLGIHLACALLMLVVVRRTLDMPAIPPALSTRAADLATAASVLWVVHPLNTEVVEYVTQRSESLMALCLLATVYAAARSFTALRARLWEAAAVAACALGMLCKESMAVAPLAVVLYERTFAFDSWR